MLVNENSKFMWKIQSGAEMKLDLTDHQRDIYI